MNSDIFDCRGSAWAPPIVRERIFDWRDFVPLVKAETTKFYHKQERGRFRYEELFSVAAEALATSKGVNYAKKAVRGALLDFARDDHKLVRNVEMSSAEFVRTRAGPEPERAAKRVARVEGNVTYLSPGPYRSNARLLAGDGKASSKHGKVSVAIEGTPYHDGWSQQDSGWVRAKAGADKQQKADPKHHKQAPGSMALLLDSPEGNSTEDGVGQADYAGHGRKQRRSGACHNAGKDYEFGLEPAGWPGGRSPDGKWSSSYKGTAAPAPIRRFEPPKLTLAEAAIRSGRRTSGVRVDMTTFGLDPAPKDKLGRHRKALAMEGPKAGKISWHRDVGDVQVDREVWGVPARRVFCRPVEGILLRPDQDPWRRGIDLFPKPKAGSPSPSLDRAVEHFWKSTVARWIGKKSRKLFSPGVIKSPVRGDVISRGAPSRPCSAPLALGGSRAGGANLAPWVETAQSVPLFANRPILSRGAGVLTLAG